MTATTGAAACNIGGVTIHSALGISGKEIDEDHWTRRLTPKKYEEWRTRRYIIIDEVSMLNCKTMMQVNSQLGKATGNNEEDFGGINVLFLGDFLQLPVVKNYNLYERKMMWEKNNDLWRSLNAVVILTKQMRQAKDPGYADLLRRARWNQLTSEDIAVLEDRIGVPLPEGIRIPTVVRRHAIRHAINAHKLQSVAQDRGHPMIYCVADIAENHGISKQDIQSAVKAGMKNSPVDGILALIPEAPLIITTNIDQELDSRNPASDI